MVSSLFNFIFGISTFVFPIMGSALAESVGFRLAFDIVSLVVVASSSAYLVQ